MRPTRVSLLLVLLLASLAGLGSGNCTRQAERRSVIDGHRSSSEFDTGASWQHWKASVTNTGNTDDCEPEWVATLRAELLAGTERSAIELKLHNRETGRSTIDLSGSLLYKVTYLLEDSWRCEVEYKSVEGIMAMDIAVRVQIDSGVRTKFPAGAFSGLNEEDRISYSLIADADFSEMIGISTTTSLIRAVNMLVSIGEERSLEVIFGYLKHMEVLSSRIEGHLLNQRKFLSLLSILYPRPTSGRQSHTSDTELVLTPGMPLYYPLDCDLNDWPMYPATIVRDCPFIVSGSHISAGFRMPEADLVRRCARTRRFRSQCLQPGNPILAALQLSESNLFLRLSTDGLSESPSMTAYGRSIVTREVSFMIPALRELLNANEVPKSIRTIISTSPTDWSESELRAVCEWMGNRDMAGVIFWDCRSGRFEATVVR